MDKFVVEPKDAINNNACTMDASDSISADVFSEELDSRSYEESDQFQETYGSASGRVDMLARAFEKLSVLMLSEKDLSLAFRNISVPIVPEQLAVVTPKGVSKNRLPDLVVLDFVEVLALVDGLAAHLKNCFKCGCAFRVLWMLSLSPAPAKLSCLSYLFRKDRLPLARTGRCQQDRVPSQVWFYLKDELMNLQRDRVDVGFALLVFRYDRDQQESACLADQASIADYRNRCVNLPAWGKGTTD